jgi:hypothetical protein
MTICARKGGVCVAKKIKLFSKVVLLQNFGCPKKHGASKKILVLLFYLGPEVKLFSFRTCKSLFFKQQGCSNTNSSNQFFSSRLTLLATINSSTCNRDNSHFSNRLPSSSKIWDSFSATLYIILYLNSKCILNNPLRPPNTNNRATLA